MTFGEPKWTFKTDGGRKVTVKAPNLVSAQERAHGELDRRCAKRGDEPPVGWGLHLQRISTLVTPGDHK